MQSDMLRLGVEFWEASHSLPLALRMSVVTSGAAAMWQPRGRSPPVNGADLQETHIISTVSNKVRSEASSIPIPLHTPFICLLLKPLIKNLSLIYTFVLVETHTDKPLRSRYGSNVNSFIKVSLILPIKPNFPLLKTAPALYLTVSSRICGSLPQSTGMCIPQLICRQKPSTDPAFKDRDSYSPSNSDQGAGQEINAQEMVVQWLAGQMDGCRSR